MSYQRDTIEDAINHLHQAKELLTLASEYMLSSGNTSGNDLLKFIKELEGIRNKYFPWSAKD
jgi:hypothetical protein